MFILLTVLAAMLVFGAVIFVHELGHFMVAKKSGIKINEFSMGMGPVLFSRKKGETKYSLRLFPVGGFVSMEGEDEESDDSRSFQKAALWKRFLVIIAGAVMNILLGFLALVLLVSTGGDIASKTISKIRVESSVFEVGDTILRVNGRRCFIVNDIYYEFARTQNGTFTFEVLRDGERVQLENVVFDVEKAKDPDTGEYIIDDNTGEPYEYMDVGFYVEPIKRNFFTVMREAFNSTLSFARLIYLSLLDLIAGRVPINQLSGPVGIVTEISKAVKIGWQPVVQMLALISINLGIMNMLPVPALDGGRAVLLVIEGIRGKKINPKYEIAINVAGFALLITMMIFVSFNDIMKLAF